MVDMGSIAAAVAGLKAATDIAKNILDLKSQAEIQSKVIELQSVILSAQSSAFAAQSEQMMLLEKVRDLESSIGKLQAWNAEKERYQLTDMGGGTFAYKLKPDKAQGQPTHHLCAKCFEEGRPSILQSRGRNSFSQDRCFCPLCKTDFVFGASVRPHFPTHANRSEF